MSLCVLIVDDSDSFLDAASVLLEREGLTVVGVASTCADALCHAESLHPDVVLVDAFLGEERGFELARQLVEADQEGGASVILMSTHDGAEFEDLIDASLAAGFLSKTEMSASAISRIVERRSR